MCHSWVKRLIKWDHKKIFKFAPLESETARKLLTPLFPDYIREDTIVYYDTGKIYLRSEAALRIISNLDFPLSFMKTGLLIPKTIRDAAYKAVARQRYKFGKRYESCPLPPAEWRDRFLN